MTINVECHAVAIAKTKKGSWKIVFVTENADLFTVYTKDQLTEADAESLEEFKSREFEVNLSDTPLFFKKGEDKQ